MPVANITYKEYGRKVTVSAAEALERAQRDPIYPWPYPMLHAIVNPEARPTEGYSATTLEQECVRCVVLQARESYTLDLDRNWARFRGTLHHSLMENGAQENAVVELRFFGDLGGDCIHGKLDELLLVPDGYVVRDWKFPKSGAPRWDKPWDNHVAQLNVYRWLVDHHDRKVTGHHGMNDRAGLDDILDSLDAVRGKCQSLVVCYVDDSGPKPLECRRSINAPKKSGPGTKKVRVPDIWDDAKVEAYMRERVDRIKAAFAQYDDDGTLPDFDDHFDPISPGSLHSYSDTARLCLERWREGR